MQDGVVDHLGAAEVDRRWLPNLGAGWALKLHAELLGRVFKVTFLELGTQFGVLSSGQYSDWGLG